MDRDQIPIAHAACTDHPLTIDENTRGSIGEDLDPIGHTDPNAFQIVEPVVEDHSIIDGVSVDDAVDHPNRRHVELLDSFVLGVTTMGSAQGPA